VIARIIATCRAYRLKDLDRLLLAGTVGETVYLATGYCLPLVRSLSFGLALLAAGYALGRLRSVPRFWPSRRRPVDERPPGAA
jgi:hypothetical protein